MRSAKLSCSSLSSISDAVFPKGFKTLLQGHPNMDSLIAVGTGAALVQGLLMIVFLQMGKEVAMHGHHPELYFESAAVILTLITLGKYFEARAKGQTSEAIKKLMDLAPRRLRSCEMVRKCKCRLKKWWSVTRLLFVLGNRFLLMVRFSKARHVWMSLC